MKIIDVVDEQQEEDHILKLLRAKVDMFYSCYFQLTGLSVRTNSFPQCDLPYLGRYVSICMTACTVSPIKRNFDSPRRLQPFLWPKKWFGNRNAIRQWSNRLWLERKPECYLPSVFLILSWMPHIGDVPDIRHYNTQAFRHDYEKREKRRRANTVGTPDVSRATGPAICNITADTRQMRTC